jgi:hypothetical protein
MRRKSKFPDVFSTDCVSPVHSWRRCAMICNEKDSFKPNSTATPAHPCCVCRPEFRERSAMRTRRPDRNQCSSKAHLNFKYTLWPHRKKQFNLGCGPEGWEDKWGWEKGGKWGLCASVSGISHLDFVHCSTITVTPLRDWPRSSTIWIKILTRIGTAGLSDKELQLTQTVYDPHNKELLSLKLYNDQRNAQVFNSCIYLLLPYMFLNFF